MATVQRNYHDNKSPLVYPCHLVDKNMENAIPKMKQNLFCRRVILNLGTMDSGWSGIACIDVHSTARFGVKESANAFLP